MIYDMIIIGGGPAGLTAANNTSQRGLKTLVLEAKSDCGGQPHNIFPHKLIKDHPGFPNGVAGEELSKRLLLQAKRSGAIIITNEEVKKIRKNKKNISVKTQKNTYQSRKVIIATGLLSQPRKHPILEKVNSIHISHKIKKIDYSNKEVLIVGGGDSSFDNAHQLSDVAKKVHVLVKEPYAKAKEITVNEVIKNGVKIHYSAEAVDIRLGRNKIEYVTVDVYNKQIRLTPDEIIICIGYLSTKDFLEAQGLKLNSDGSIMIDHNFETNIIGVYAAGDVIGEIKLIAVACSDGISAAIHAFEEIKKPYWLH